MTHADQYLSVQFGELRDGLRVACESGSTATLRPAVRDALVELDLITGSEADNSGVVLTDRGRVWHTRWQLWACATGVVDLMRQTYGDRNES